MEKKLENKKNKGGRPTKLTTELLAVLARVIDEYIYCTDEELVFMLNEELPKSQQISYDTFRDYKSGRSQSANELITEFSTLVKKALIKEKMELLKDLKKGSLGWQSKAWIIERKWQEWNKIDKSEQKVTGNEMNVTVNSPEAKKDLDNLINKLK